MTTYKAFISYSHVDSKWASKLHRKLESFELTKDMKLATNFVTSRPLKPVFIDRDELGAAEVLSDSIQAALNESERLIVVCSPASRQSKWVNREIAYFRATFPNRPVFAFVVDGDPGADSLTDSLAAFPTALVLSDPEDEHSARLEPLAADARESADGFKLAFLKLAAGMLGVRFDQLRQRQLRQQQRRWALAGTTSFILMLAFAAIAWQAVVSRDAAKVAQQQAEIELITERETRDFLLSVFQLADPSETRGNEISVREILDRGVKRISSAQFSSPEIKAKFLNTMAQAYSNLGLNKESLELFASSSEAINSSVPSSTRSQLVIENLVAAADVYYKMGDYDQARSTIEKIFNDPAMLRQTSAAQRVKLFNIKGDIHSYAEEDAEADEAYKKAISILDSEIVPIKVSISERSRSLGGRALIAHFAGQAQQAESWYLQASELLINEFGEDHPDTIWALSSLASAAYVNNNRELARSTWERQLKVATQVLSAGHPEIATILSSLGLLELESGVFGSARQYLGQAIKIDREKRAERFDDLVYPLSNLALLNIVEGDLAAAKELVQEARNIIGEREHRWLGPVQNHLADIACADGRFAEGITFATSAVEITAAEFGGQAWRTEQAKMQLMLCQLALGQQVYQPSLTVAFDAIFDKWGPNSVYTQRAISQLLSLESKLDSESFIEKLNASKLGWGES